MGNTRHWLHFGNQCNHDYDTYPHYKVYQDMCTYVTNRTIMAIVTIDSYEI